MEGADFKERLLAAIPIEVYIGRYVPLKKQGRQFKGLCPFHSEKTPSFHVTPERGIYHCFGCGKGGDLFSFVMEQEGVSFTEALDILSRHAGIERPRGRVSAQEKRMAELAEINDRAVRRFGEFLASSDGERARGYLRERHVAASVMETYALGASPDSWHWLVDGLKAEEKDLLELGLLKKGKSGSYDFFRDRIIFPIRDTRGRVAGFGGRVMPGSDNPAKYLNSPDSLLFHKSHILYGLYEGARAIRDAGECIVSEGYLDVIGLAQAGIGNAVAPLGTALTASHLQLIHRYAGRVALLLDGDRAGRAAALRSARLIVDHGGMDARVILLPQGLDAFDLSVGLENKQLQKLVSQSIPAEQFLLIETMFPDFAEKSALYKGTPSVAEAVALTEQVRTAYVAFRTVDMPINEKRTARTRLLEFTRTLKEDTDRELFLGEGARLLGIDPAALASDRPGKRQAAAVAQSSEPEAAAQPVSPEQASREHELLAELIVSPHLVGRYREEINELQFADPFAEVVWRNVESRFLTGATWTAESFQHADLPAEALALVSRVLVRRADHAVEAESPERAGELVRELILTHELTDLRSDLRRLEHALGDADALERDDLHRKYMKLVGREKEIAGGLRGGSSGASPTGGAS